MMQMRLYSTNPNIPGIGGHVQEYSLLDLPRLDTDPHYSFLLAFTPAELEQNKDALKAKLSDHWVGDVSIIDCIQQGIEPTDRWHMQTFSLPSIKDNFEDREIFVYRSDAHKSRMIVCTDLLDHLVKVRPNWWEQGIAIGTLYAQRFQESVLDYCEIVCKHLNNWRPKTAGEANEKKFIVSTLKSRWAELGHSNFFEREDHKRRHATITKSIEIAEDSAKTQAEYHIAKEQGRPASIRMSAATPATNLQKIADLIGNATITAVFDPYLDDRGLGVLGSVLALSSSSTPIANTVRFLCSPTRANSTPPKLTKTFLHTWMQQIGITAAELRFVSGEHRRFFLLDDGQSLIIGASLNSLGKNEAALLEPDGSDLTFFNSTWTTATPF